MRVDGRNALLSVDLRQSLFHWFGVSIAKALDQSDHGMIY
jgi:hypothetical protein